MNKIKVLLTVGISTILINSCANRQGYIKDKDEKVTISDGYSITNTNNYTGAAKTLDGIEQWMPLEDYLRKVSGVSVIGSGPSAQIIIRGMGTVNAAYEPLFVINGAAVNGGFSTVSSILNSTDIESISVLKDASSTGIYGTRAANGVIVIKLKEG
ncbi:MAG: TonB-dependent SusC/RagA subfamily outer membrane receptor [Arcticibacterium sp.]|jgi:TonB-dependent SusC/RagA subfamily outer membrane receptor